ncbi:MAG: thioredoxin family protein [Bacteroidota bacterium]
MKKFLTITAVLLLASASSLRAQEEKILTGPVTVADLIDLPGWFGEDYLGYKPVSHYIDRIPDLIKDVDIVCVLGTWCSDSKRDVPRMIRIFQTKNIPPEKLQMIGVDRDKRSPNGEASQYNVDRVPTFIFIRNGREIGRIVEAPLASLEKDMLGIIDPEAGKAEAAPVPAATSDDGSQVLDGSDRDPEEVRMQDEKKRLEQERQRHEAEMQKK